MSASGRTPESSEHLPSDRDRIFLEDAPETFRFDDAVARVLPDMLRRSIPGYSALLHMIGVLAGEVVVSKSRVYDLGCSLGAVSLAIRHGIGARDAHLIAVDNSPAMVQRCREVMSADSGLCPVEVIEGDITDFPLDDASLIVLNFTLQFAPPAERELILARVAGALRPGGVVVLSEKTTEHDAELEDFWTRMHDAFRRSNGYSNLEMSRKREALERVLIPQTTKSYEEMLVRVGLVPFQWFRCLHFVSFIGKKPR